MQPSLVIDSRRQAFTIVELMTSSVILSLLVLMLAGTFNQVSRAWISASDHVEQRGSARVLADYMSVELQAALLPIGDVAAGTTASSGSSGGTGGTVTTTPASNLRFVINPTEISDDYRYADAIFWQAPIATETTYGDTAEIGYFVKWDDSVLTTPKPQLCRYFVNPSATTATGVELNSNFQIFASNASSWLGSSMITAVAPATKAQGYQGLFGENVVGLWVRSFRLAGDELNPENHKFDSRPQGTDFGGYLNDFVPVGSNSVYQSWKERRYLPARVQVSIAQLDSRHAQNLAPVAAQLRQLSQSASIHNADEFQTKVRQQANPGTPLASVIEGLRTYTIDVQLQNGR